MNSKQRSKALQARISFANNILAIAVLFMRFAQKIQPDVFEEFMDTFMQEFINQRVDGLEIVFDYDEQ